MKYAPKLTILTVAALCTIGTACKKKIAAAPPPPPPAPTATSTPKPALGPARASAAPSPSATTQPPRYPNAATRARIDELLAKIEDAYFDYDKASLRPDALKALDSDATELREILRDYPDYKLTIEGHCDERGSEEYNMALGDRRAQTARDYLVQAGITAGQFSVISYGKDRPVCQEHNEACWQKNRHIHIVAMAQLQH